MKKMAICVWVIFDLMILTQGAIPGTFFWKPRLGLDLSLPTTEQSSIKALIPTSENIKSGMVVLLEGYQAGATVIALAAGMSSAGYFPHLNPQTAYYYTNAYRWILRYISLLPFWIGGNGGHYCETFKVWKRRFYYMDEFVPGWLRSAISVVGKDEWEKEEKEFKKFKKFAEPAFGKHFRYPSKSFNNFQSEITVETQENMDISSASIDNA